MDVTCYYPHTSPATTSITRTWRTYFASFNDPDSPSGDTLSYPGPSRILGPDWTPRVGRVVVPDLS